jgi:hypothetical protein
MPTLASATVNWTCPSATVAEKVSVLPFGIAPTVADQVGRHDL